MSGGLVRGRDSIRELLPRRVIITHYVVGIVCDESMVRTRYICELQLTS